MVRRFARAALSVSVLGACLLGSAPAPASGDPTSNPHTVPGRALVRFRSGTDDAIRRLIHARSGARVLSSIPSIGYDVVSFDAPADAVLSSYRADPSVAIAEPVLRGKVALAPDDSCVAACTGAAGQWHLAMTNAPGGWGVFPGRTFTAASRPASPVTIAILDTKIDRTHPDFANTGSSSTDARDGGQLDVARGKDWIPSSRWGGSAVYHGNLVAGLAAGATGNGRDVAGVGYAARIMPLTVVDGGGNTDSAALADAIVYAWQNGARVINLSLGILGSSAAVHDAIKKVSGTSLVVAAAGNNTGNAPFYPGSYPEVLSVAGTDANDRPASCSNYNANVGVSAPADRLIGLTAMPTRLTQAPCGTSAATPQVSGLAALLFMQDPSRTPAQVRALVERGADDLGAPGRDDRYGAGRINIERSLKAGGPAVTLARATIASGGVSTITARATSTSSVRAAQIVFDRPDAAPVAMSAKDGSFGGVIEDLTLAFRVPAGTKPGPHPVWIRAYDGTSWGAAAATILAVDTRAPAISGAAATNAVRAANQAVTVTFAATDDYASAISWGVEFRSTATGQVVHRVTKMSVPAGGQSVSWLPSLNLPGGPYAVKIAVADQSGNVSSTEVGTVVA